MSVTSFLPGDIRGHTERLANATIRGVGWWI